MQRTLVIVLSLLAAAVVGTGLMLVRDFHRRVVLGIPGKYSAQTRFEILYAADWYNEDQETKWLQSQVRLMTSTEVLLPVIKRLELERAWQTSAEEAESRISRLVWTAREPGTAIISVTVCGEGSDETADIANAIRESYADLRRHPGQHSSGLSPWISPKAQRQLEVVEKTMADLAAIRKKHDITEPAALPSDAPAAHEGHDEYQAANQRYQAEKQLLDDLVERSMQAKVDEDVIRHPVKIVEVAVADTGH